MKPAIRGLSARVLALSLVLAGAVSAQAADYQIDVAHSRVGFAVKHMMISTVEGKFNEFEGAFSFDPEKGTLGTTNFVVKAASIETGVAKRDGHLKSGDFFDVEKYPTISVTNSKIKKTGKNKYEWDGDLNMHGVTKPVKFNMEYLGSIKDPMNPTTMTRAAFTATSKINRKDWNLTWNKAMDGGGVVVSDEVTIKVDIEATAPAAPTAKTAAAK